MDQVKSAIGQGVRFSWMTFEEDSGKVPAFWFALDDLGQWTIGEVPSNRHCWPTRPHYRSHQTAHASKRVDKPPSPAKKQRVPVGGCARTVGLSYSSPVHAV